MIYNCIFEILKDPHDYDFMELIKSWKDVNVARYLITSSRDRSLFLTSTPSAMQSIKSLKDDISKSINWQLLYDKNYIILWKKDLAEVMQNYIPLLDKANNDIGCEYFTIRTYDHIKESNWIKTIQLINKRKIAWR